MDYKTKSTSRRDLRCYSQILRKIFNVPLTGAFPVLEVLDKISDVFKDCNYEIVDDKKLSPQVSHSDGTPVVDVNIERSTHTGGIKKQKIHFIKEES